MAWQPDTPYKKTETKVTAEELRADLLQHRWDGLEEFISLLRDDDEIVRVEEGNNNRGGAYLYVRRKSGVKITLVESSYMS